MSIWKGQSAIEYLMTYGWMLLVVAVVGGAVFSVVGNQSIESVSGFTGGDLEAGDFGFTDEGLVFSMQGTSAETIDGLEACILDNGVEIECRDIGEVEVTGQTITPPFTCLEESSGTNNFDIELNYDMGGLENLATSGTITANLKEWDGCSQTTEQLLQDGTNWQTKRTSRHIWERGKLLNKNHPDGEEEIHYFSKDRIEDDKEEFPVFREVSSVTSSGLSSESEDVFLWEGSDISGYGSHNSPPSDIGYSLSVSSRLYGDSNSDRLYYGLPIDLTETETIEFLVADNAADEWVALWDPDAQEVVETLQYNEAGQMSSSDFEEFSHDIDVNNEDLYLAFGTNKDSGITYPADSLAKITLD